MKIVAAYEAATVHAKGCRGAEVGSRMHADAGGGAASHLFGADIAAFPVGGFAPTHAPRHAAAARRASCAVTLRPGPTPRAPR